LAVPPDDPTYTLRRVWLSREEEQGYYYGFANEGLWPLCHLAHGRWNSTSSCTRAWRRWRVRVKARMEPLYGAFAVLILANKGGTPPGIAAILPTREPKDRLERTASGAMRIVAPAGVACQLHQRRRSLPQFAPTAYHPSV